MDRQQLWDLIMEKRPKLLEGKSIETITDEEIVGLARMAMDPPSPESPAQPHPAADGDGQNYVTKDELAAWRCEMAMEKALSASDLPDKSKERVRKLFSGKIFEDGELQRAIADEKDFLAAVRTPGGGEGDPPEPANIRVGIGTLQRAQMAVDRAFGLTGEDMKAFSRMTRLDNRPFFDDPVLRSRQDIESFEDIPAFTGLRDMYEFFTGDKEVTGRFMRRNLPPELRASMDITSGTFTYVLGNTLARRLVKDYMAFDFHENLLISLRKPVKDFRQQEAVLVGYFGDLDTVDPETENYDEIAAVTDEESTYTIAQKGNILTITRKTIINDDISLIVRLVSRLGRAARRTHAQYVWNFWINNSNCSDGTAWFTEGHGNLTTNGLGTLANAYGYIQTAYIALAKMTEKDSGKRIGLLDSENVKPVLIYPVDLLANCEAVVSDDFYYSADALTAKTRNPMKGKIRGQMISLFTDANDWGLLMPPEVIDMVEMGYLNGRQEPEMFVADSPQSEQVFVADKIRHKIRHEYAGAVVDYRSGYKGTVA